jgi:hypothetical protein
MDAAWMKSRFPAAKLVCPNDAMTKVRAVVDIDGSCEELLPKAGVKVHTIPGVKATELAYEVDSGNGPSLLFCDCMMNLPQLPKLGGKIMGALGSTGFFGTTRLGKIFLVKDRSAFKDWLKSISEKADLHSVIPAHGDPVRMNARIRVAEAADRL